ncbi:Naphthalene 1,2-dioxygenase subunit alpha [Roseovarius albus]|uniref:Naphthalene 1,2-dioxygenase subunit alpha n=1 Tax=Roseovarius albus TaxID=1247867 RepID=A0A1X6ZL52_9RHOB|nr:aromatic ring-hydroxylating dioxygenase subunit alpha [Roseovarius albus]SLN55076.1 Naphthalene 1,2-dioxygenase subunit alpha [Roseovarius albus]
MSNMLHLLPTKAYTSQEWFDREMRDIFSKTWRYAGFMEDVSEPGQYISVQAGLNNIFIVMGRDRRLRAFHNICRHRGTQLIRAVGKTQKALTCPYHDWTYDLEGNLISVPEEHEEFGKVDKACHGLKPASVDIWKSMIFVHPDPDAAPITDWFGPVEEHIGPHVPEELIEYEEARNSYEIKANWKIVVENYIDVYHLSHLHSGTLQMYDQKAAEYHWQGDHYMFWEPPVPEYAENQDAKLPAPRVIPEDQNGAWVPMLWPGIGIGSAEDGWNIFIIEPLGPALTRVHNRSRVANVSEWAFSKQAMKSSSFWNNFGLSGKYEGNDASSEDDPMAGGDFTAEDIYACEQQQASLNSPYFETGPAAQGESPVIEHQKRVLKWLGEA